MSTIFKLIIEDDEGKTTVYPLVEGEVSIGRKEGNTIRLMERNVSRRHARLVRQDDGIFLEDLDSYNGVRINGERIASRFRIREGDLIEIGDYHLALRRADDQDAAEATQPLGDDNDTHDSQEGDAGWPAGTVPDFQLPEDLLGGEPGDSGAPAGAPPAHDPAPSAVGPALDATPEPEGGARTPGAGAVSDRPTDRPAQRTADHPGERPVTERPGERPTERPGERPTERPGERPTDRPGERPIDRPAERLTERPGERPSDRATDRSGDRASDWSAAPNEALGPEPTQQLSARGGASLPPFPAPQPGEGEGGQTDPSEVATPRPSRRPLPGDAIIGDTPTRRLERGLSLVADVPRLVCVSTEYAGRAFPLDRGELVIGRIEDNDIVIEHRSVSRNHAKVRLDGRTHRIIDLQSANGVLVNGEEYAMTNLRGGDLIELGNVRFRYVPAGVPFEATNEEAREMRANGIEPPATVASEPPGFAPYDPSAAATVTDAPRSALPVASSPPTVGAAAPTAPLPTHRNGEVTEADARAVARGPHGPDDRSATRLDPIPGPTVVDRPDTPTEDVAPYDTFEPAPVLEQEPRYRRLMVALIAVLAVVVLVLFTLLLRRGDAQLDRRLEELYNQGNYAEAKAFYEAHEDDFADERKAAILYGRAGARLEESAGSELRSRASADADGPDGLPKTEGPTPSATIEEANAPDASARAGDETRRSSGSSGGSEDALPARRQAEARRGARLAAGPERRSTRRERVGRTSDVTEASRLSRLGRDALIAGDLARAERYLTDCVERAPRTASCHRSLGILYAHKQDDERAVEHYRRYVELAPQAPDADRVRSMISKFENEGGQR